MSEKFSLRIVESDLALCEGMTWAMDKVLTASWRWKGCDEQRPMEQRNDVTDECYVGWNISFECCNLSIRK